MRQFHKTCWATALTLEEKRNGHKSFNKKKFSSNLLSFDELFLLSKVFLKSTFYYVSLGDLTADLPDKW